MDLGYGMLCTIDEEGNLCSMLGVRYESLTAKFFHSSITIEDQLILQPIRQTQSHHSNILT